MKEIKSNVRAELLKIPNQAFYWWFKQWQDWWNKCVCVCVCLCVCFVLACKNISLCFAGIIAKVLLLCVGFSFSLIGIVCGVFSCGSSSLNFPFT
jgi:hypothetical protein